MGTGSAIDLGPAVEASDSSEGGEVGCNVWLCIAKSSVRRCTTDPCLSHPGQAAHGPVHVHALQYETARKL